MKKIDILYFIEHLPREFDIACIVKFYCQQKFNLKVRIASLPHQRNEVINDYQPKIIVMPFFYAANTPITRPIVEKFPQAVYLNLNFEQFFFKGVEAFKSPKDDFAKNQVWQHVWSNDFKKYLIEFGVKPQKIIVNGNPSLALYQKPYSQFYPNRKDLAQRYQLDEKKIWLFFPENYGWAFLTLAEIRSRIKYGYNPRLAFQNHQFNIKSLNRVIDWLGKISRRDEIEIIVRPRPAISQQEYLKKFNARLGTIPSSIKIIKHGSVREWNLTADLVVSSISTSLLEAAIASKPAYVLEPYQFPKWMEAKFLKLFKPLRTFQEFETVCLKPQKSASQKAKNYLLKTQLGKGDTILKIAQILNRLSKIKIQPNLQNKTQPKKNFSEIIKNSNQNLLSQIKAKISGSAQRFADDFLTQKNIDNNIKKWSKILI